MVRPTGEAGSETFPAASAAVALNRWVPRGSSPAGLQLNAPAPFAFTSQSVAPVSALVTVTALAASAVPLSTGRCLRLGEASWSSSGGAGGVVSITRARAMLGPEKCPLPSVSRATNRYDPSTSAAPGRQLQPPVAVTVPEQTGVSPFMTATDSAVAAVRAKVAGDDSVPVKVGEAFRVGDFSASKSGAVSVRTLSVCEADGPLRFAGGGHLERTHHVVPVFERVRRAAAPLAVVGHAAGAEGVVEHGHHEDVVSRLSGPAERHARLRGGRVEGIERGRAWQVSVDDEVTLTDVLTFPAASCWVAEAVCVPSSSAGGVHVQLPLAETAAWHRIAPDAVTETRAAVSPRPENTGLLTLEGSAPGPASGRRWRSSPRNGRGSTLRRSNCRASS